MIEILLFGSDRIGSNRNYYRYNKNKNKRKT